MELFDHFCDLIDILSVALSLSRDVSSKIALRLLEQELIECGRGFLAKESGQVNAAIELVLPLVHELKLTIKRARIDDKISLRDEQFNRLLDVALGCFLRLKPSVAAIERVATLPAFAEFSPADGSVKPGPLQLACFRLLSVLQGLADRDGGYHRNRGEFLEEAHSVKGKPKLMSMSIVVSTLAQGLHHLRAFNELSNIILYLKTGVGPLLDPNRDIPFSPLVDAPQGALADLPTAAEFIDWLQERVDDAGARSGGNQTTSSKL